MHERPNNETTPALPETSVGRQVKRSVVGGAAPLLDQLEAGIGMAVGGTMAREPITLIRRRTGGT
jgi:hypothetical protein